MASERVARLLASQAGVLAAGGAAAWAVTHGLYASALTAALGGAALAVAQLDDAGAGRVRRPGAEAPPRSWDTPLLRTLLSEVPAPLLLLEPDGGVRAVNRAARALFDTDDRLVRPAPELLRALREDAAGARRRLSLAGAGGAARLYALSLADVGTSGAPLRLGALLDVQAEVHAAEAETLRRVLQVLGHELMNSLTPVTSLAETAADLLAGRPDADTVLAAREALATIGRRAGGLAQFVSGYRAVARLPEPRPRAVDVIELVEDAVRLVRARPDAQAVKVCLDGSAKPLVRVTDPDLVSQALSNVLINAVEAAVGSREKTVRLTITALPGGARLEVSDSGSGVPPTEAETIFLPLTTGKVSGLGVGLHLARSAMRSLGGDVALVDRVEAESKTCFVLLL